MKSQLIEKTKWVAIIAAAFTAFPAGAEEGKKKISLTEVEPAITPVSNYSGDFLHRSTVLGDWGGERKRLYDKGITFDATVTQTFQGVVDGGASSSSEYYGLVDYGVTLDTGKLGLWSGGLLTFNAQSNWGNNSLLADAGSLSPVNFLQVYPTADVSSTFLMEFYLTQALSEKVGVVIGRINATNFLDRNWFANDPRNQFMNLALNNDPLLGGFLSFSTYGLLVSYEANKHLDIAFAAFDPNAVPGDYGVEEGFFNDWGFALDIGLNWGDPKALNGSLHTAFIYTDKDALALDNPYFARDAVRQSLGGAPLPKKSDNYMMNMTLNQFLWKPAQKSSGGKNPVADPYANVQTADYAFNERGFGFYGRFGIVPDDRNFFDVFLSGGVGGRGVFEARPFDRFGAGVYWLNASNDLSNLPGSALASETGFEVYYSVALTPSVQLTGDLQYIDTGRSGIDDPLVLGLRLTAQF